MSDSAAKGDAVGGWQKHFSKTHQTHYWHNQEDGRTSWVDPVSVSASVPVSNVSAENVEKKRSIDDGVPSSSTALHNRESSDNAMKKNRTSYSEIKPEIAIIVPYRDLHKEQSRKQQLDLFIPSITKFMELNKKTSATYRIYIIEQSNDDRKFNRGKLLNIGFQIACSEGCKALIFHDVDLIPSAGLHFIHLSIHSFMWHLSI